jgi:hypothetical protein
MQMKPRQTAKKNNRVIFTNKIEYSKSWKLLLIEAFILIKTITVQELPERLRSLP